MKVREVIAGCEYEIQTTRAQYTIRETRKGELIIEALDRNVNHEFLDTRTLILDQERK